MKIMNLFFKKKKTERLILIEIGPPTDLVYSLKQALVRECFTAWLKFKARDIYGLLKTFEFAQSAGMCDTNLDIEIILLSYFLIRRRLFL